MYEKLKKRKSIVILSLIILLFLSINIILSFLIEQKLDEFLLKNNTDNYITKVANVDFKLFSGSIRLENISLAPSSEFYGELKAGNTLEKDLIKIKVSTLKLNKIGVIKLLFSKTIQINQLIIDSLLIQQFENQQIVKKDTSKQLPINIDSIVIEKLNGLSIKKIKFNHLHYQKIDISDNNVMFQNNPLSFESTGFKLEKYQENLFKLKPIEKAIEINNIDLTFEDTHFQFSIDTVQIQFEEKMVSFKNLNLKPLMEPTKLANTYEFNNDVIGIHVDELNLFNYNFFKTLNHEGVFIDSVLVDGLDLDIYKDKRKPFDMDKRPKLPHLALKKLEMPLHIQSVIVNNGNLKLEHRLDKRNLSMKLSIDDISAQITNITSIEAFRENPMKVSINAKFMEQATMKVNMNFPLKDHEDTFYFAGSLGKAKLYLFDTAIFPVLGLKVLRGDLDKLTFNASANEISSSGKMTMLYHDLEAEVFKANSVEENSFLSWTINHVVRESNPGKNNKIRKVTMENTRTEYKGLGNYFWKTLQNGIVNTMAPFGIKTENEKSKKKNRKKNN